MWKIVVGIFFVWFLTYKLIREIWCYLRDIIIMRKICDNWELDSKWDGEIRIEMKVKIYI